MSYKFLLFDLDHTLLDFDAAEDIALTHLLKEKGDSSLQRLLRSYEQGPLEGFRAKKNQ